MTRAAGCCAVTTGRRTRAPSRRTTSWDTRAAVVKVSGQRPPKRGPHNGVVGGRMTSLSLSPRDQVHETHSIEAGCDAFVKQPGRWRVGKTRACRKPEGNKHCAVGAAAQLVLVFVLAAPHKLRVPSPRHQGQGPIARGRQTPQAATGLPVLDLVAGHLDGPRGAREDLALKPAQLQRDVRAHDGQPGFGNRPFQADFTEPGSVFQVVGHQAGGCVQPGDGVGDVDDQRGAAAVRGHATFDGCTRQHRHHVGLGGVHFAGARAVAQQQHRFGKHGVGVVCVFFIAGQEEEEEKKEERKGGAPGPGRHGGRAAGGTLATRGPGTSRRPTA